MLITLTEDGPLGKAGDRVWVNDPVDAQRASKDEPKTEPKHRGKKS